MKVQVELTVGVSMSVFDDDPVVMVYSGRWTGRGRELIRSGGSTMIHDHVITPKERGLTGSIYLHCVIYFRIFIITHHLFASGFPNLHLSNVAIEFRKQIIPNCRPSTSVRRMLKQRHTDG